MAALFLDVVGMDVEVEQELMEETPRKRPKRPKHKRQRRDNYEDSESEPEVVPIRAAPKKSPAKKSPLKVSPAAAFEPLRISERTPKPSLRLKEAESSAQMLERSSSERSHRPSQKMREVQEQVESSRSSDRTPKPSLKLKIKLAEDAG
jgi:hypothetical protein